MERDMIEDLERRSWDNALIRAAGIEGLVAPVGKARSYPKSSMKGGIL